MNNSALFTHQTITLISALTNTHFSEITEFIIEKESQKYKACSLKLKEKQIIYRHAHTTPKKVGQFVTFWKRDTNKQTAPLSESDTFDYFIIVTEKDTNIGYFKFPKLILIEKGIISSEHKEGKRGFRVYPPWDIASNKQALNTQKWQLNYFVQSSKNQNYSND
ncbi:MAG: MepB family protein [Flavobacteriaceae bacterium]|nr:MAG: MepB family protein [Flavobacteriaceae bacterium]